MMRYFLCAAACLALAACSDADGGYPHYPGRDVHAEAPPPPPPQMEVHRTAEATEFVIPDTLLFATDSARVLPMAQEIVGDIATEGRRHPGAPLEVNGYTDTTGTRAHNQRLSEARAQSVAEVLVQSGVPGQRIRARGFGENELAVATPDHTSKLDNRRVVVRLLNP